MSSPATYNRNAVGRHWHLRDIPAEWQGYAILLQGDLDRDQILEDTVNLFYPDKARAIEFSVIRR